MLRLWIPCLLALLSCGSVQAGCLFGPAAPTQSYYVPTQSTMSLSTQAVQYVPVTQSAVMNYVPVNQTQSVTMSYVPVTQSQPVTMNYVPITQTMSVGQAQVTQGIFTDAVGFTRNTACATCRALGGDSGSATVPRGLDDAASLINLVEKIIDLVEKKKTTGALSPKRDLESEAFEARMARLDGIRKEISELSEKQPTPVAATAESSTR